MSPRKRFIEKYSNEYVSKDFVQFVWDTMSLASTHDPDHAKDIRRQGRWANRLFCRVDKLEKKVGIRR
jgi:hypothetical protein